MSSSFLPLSSHLFSLFIIFYNMKYSIIVPIFNRPDRGGRTLESLTNRTITDFEVLIVEDGVNKDLQKHLR